MTIHIISYSRTGTNDRLAAQLAGQLSIEQHKIQEAAPSNYFKISLDMLLNRYPKIITPAVSLNTDDPLILVSPVWFGKIAFPMRTFLKEQKGNINNYIFISLSGGGDGPASNPKLAGELTKRTGKKPLAVINKHIADFLPQDPKPTPQDIENYTIIRQDYETVSRDILNLLKPVLDTNLAKD
ncbi:MAG: flavodoxin family protein [Fidelibacterota bacterium]